MAVATDLFLMGTGHRFVQYSAPEKSRLADAIGNGLLRESIQR